MDIRIYSRLSFLLLVVLLVISIRKVIKMVRNFGRLEIRVPNFEHNKVYGIIKFQDGSVLVGNFQNQLDLSCGAESIQILRQKRPGKSLCRKPLQVSLEGS